MELPIRWSYLLNVSAEDAVFILRGGRFEIGPYIFVWLLGKYRFPTGPLKVENRYWGGCWLKNVWRPPPLGLLEIGDHVAAHQLD